MIEQSGEHAVRAQCRRRAAVAGELADVAGPNDFVEHPEAAAPYSELSRLAGELWRWKGTHEELTGIRSNSGTHLSSRWELSELFSDYEAAWPGFYKAQPDTAWQRSESIQVPAEPTRPWGDNGMALDVLRHIAEHDLTLWAPSPAELEQAQQTIGARAYQLRENRKADVIAERARRAANQGPISPAPGAHGSCAKQNEAIKIKLEQMAAADVKRDGYRQHPGQI